MRIADEGSYAVKAALARALRDTTTSEGRRVLVYLLSDDDAQPDALVAIGASPWPEVLPALIEIAEADDRATRLAARAIAHCGATSGPDEANAAADFLLDQLDDDAVLHATADALLRFGAGLPGVLEKGKTLAEANGGARQAIGLCLVAACEDEALASLADAVANSGITPEARAYLEPLLNDRTERVRAAAERTWKALHL